MESVNRKYSEAIHLIESKMENEEKDKHFQLFKEIINILKPIVEGESTAESVCSIPRSKMARILYNLAMSNYKSQCLTDSKKCLNEALDILDGKEMHHLAIGTAISSLTQLALLANEDMDQENSLECFEKANNLYTKYKSNKSSEPATSEVLFGGAPHESHGWDYLEDLSSHNMYYQAQVLSAMNMKLKASNLFLLILHRSFHKSIDNKVEWIRNILNLCSIYMTEKYFRLAKRLLVVSLTMTQQLTEDVITVDDEENKSTVIGHLEADIFWLLGAFCSQVLERQDVDIIALEVSRSAGDSQEEMVSRVHFSPLDLSIESSLPNGPTQDYQTALRIVDKGAAWLEKARHFYSMEEHMSSYISLSQELSAIMKKMAQIEEDLPKRIKWYKKRIAVLDPITKLELGPAYQESWREIVLEIAETYEATVDMKAVVLGNSDKEKSPVNKLIHSSLAYYTKYLDSVRLEKSEKFEQAYVESALSVLLCKARLLGKVQTSSKPHQKMCIVNAVQIYEQILSYCRKYEEQSQCFKEHLPACRELRNLLMQRLNLMSGQHNG